MRFKFEMQTRKIDCIFDRVSEKFQNSSATLQKMKEWNVPTHLLFKYLMFILIGQTNYGPFVDKENLQEQYSQLDMQIIELARKILLNTPTV